MATILNSEKDRDTLKKIEYDIKTALIFAILLGWDKQKFISIISHDINKIKKLDLINKKEYVEGFWLTFLSEFDKLYLRADDFIFAEIINIIPKTQDNVSLFSKFDFDINEYLQMKMVQNAINSGVDLWWLSAHVDCSKRCQKYQGKLVSMSLLAIDKDMWTGKVVEGNKVYSFTDIENQTDKYGYHNNIINGFNCRHFLYKWTKGSKPMNPNTQREKDKLYRLNKEKLNMEREIKELSLKGKTIREYDTKLYNKYTKQKLKLINKYKHFCKHYKLRSTLNY